MISCRSPAGNLFGLKQLRVSNCCKCRHNSVLRISKTKEIGQNFGRCNNNEITACIADLFNSFCEVVQVVAFFKVMQQQTIGEVANSIAFLWADNFCLQQRKNY